jgi:hypothetical protein
MTVGYNKMESFDSIVQSSFDFDFKFDYKLNRVTEVSLPTINTTQVPIETFGNIPHWSYNVVYNGGKLFLFNNINADNSRLIIVIDTDNNNTVSTIEIDNEYKAVSEDNLLNLNNRYYNASCNNATITMIAGGCDARSKKVSDTVSIYDHKWLVWTKAKLSKPRYMMNAIEYDGKFYFICGLKEDTEISETIDIYDTKFKHSTIKTPFKGRIHMNVEAYDSKLYLIGGYDGESYVNRVDIYDINTEEWTSITVPNLLNIATKIMNDQLFITTSSNVNNEYPHKDRNNATNAAWVPDIVLVNGINASKMSENKSDDASIAFWINIPKEYIGKTYLIMKSGNSGIALHKDQLVPVFFLDGHTLIKNTNITKIEYGKWIHLVFNKTPATVSPTTVTTATATTATVTTATPNSASHEIAIYIDGSLTEYPINFSLEYNDGITLTGYEIFTEKNIEYPELGLISNIKAFNTPITFSTISDIYNMEYPMYQMDIRYSFRSLDLKTLKIAIPSTDIITRDYTNIIMESYKGSYLIMSLGYLNDDNKIETQYYKYDIKKKEATLITINIKNEIADTYINSVSVETDNGVIMGGYKGSKYAMTFIDIDDIDEVALVDCIPGEKRSDNKCVLCEVDTYSKEKNSTECIVCPPNTSTDTKKGQSKCNTTAEFRDKTIYYPINNNFQTIINANNTRYDEMKRINDEDDDNIASFKNNLDFALRM